MKYFLKSFIVFLLFEITLQGQILDYHNVITVILDDGTQVILYGKAGDDRMTGAVSGIQLSEDYSHGRGTHLYSKTSNTSSSLSHHENQSVHLESSLPPIYYLDDYYFTGEYYYLPTNLRLSKRPDGVPEFLFMKYTTEERVDAGGAQGAIMHFLMEWGLSPAQEKEAQDKLRGKIKDLKSVINLGNKYARVDPMKAVIVGPAKLSAGDGESFRIISAILNDKSTAPSLITSGKAPTLPGQKIAVASKLDKYGAQLLAATFEKNRSITDVSLELRFKYKVLMPGIKARMVINWESVQKLIDKKTKSQIGVTTSESQIASTIDLEAFVEQALSSKAVEITITDYGGSDKDDLRKTVMDGFMSTFSSAVSGAGTEKEDDQEDTRPENPEDPAAAPPSKIVNANVVHVSKFKSRMRKGVEVINLNYRMGISEEAVLTENLGTWYDGVRNNKKCVSTINLNDPFFSHRDIHFILDNKVKDVFATEVNYVTINVRKKRSSGNPFQEQITIDNNYLKEKGTRASMTYARGEDKSSDTYEYKSQWSLRGGKLWPENPEWIKGDWQGVQLSCPMVPRLIQFEADLDELKQIGIVRATLQLRYLKYGVERESNIPITVSQGKSLVESTVFIDENSPGYAYRLILTHKEKGKLAMDWDAKINDDYVYATIPKQLKDNDPSFWDKLIQNVKTIAEPAPDGTVKSENKILDKFIDIIKSAIDKK